ncbi:MAG: signal peptidase I [Clostridiales Family XIII bacterium]|nr:signal peptidase I [Clostridiales Family XIII bacterium]
MSEAYTSIGSTSEANIATRSKTASKKPKGIPHMRMSKSVMIWSRDILIALAIALIIMQFIKPTIVRQQSMENTLHPDNYIFLSKQAYKLGDVHRRDIVVFKSDLEAGDGSNKNLIKRVIGLPGDRVAIHDGGVYVNGNLLNEPYTKDGTTEGTMDEIVVPEKELFLLGDNRQGSMDSRFAEVGCVPEDLLIGKAVFRLLPLKDIGPLTNK